MARLICGIDVGASAVRAAVLRLGVGVAECKALVEVPLPIPDDGGLPPPEAVDRALLALRERLPKGLESPGTALAGDLATARLLSFPRAALRQADAAVRLELDGQLPFEISDAMFDHLVISPPAEDPAAVLAVVAQADAVRRLAQALGAVGLDPASIGVGALPLAHLLPPKHPGLSTGVLAVLDLGRLSTDLLVVEDGRPVFLRSFRTGGEDVTRAVAKAFRAGRAQAEAAKTARLALPDPGFPLPGDPSLRTLVEATETGLGALIAPLKRTLLELRSRPGRTLVPQRLLVTGGGARIPGIAPWLSARLGVPVERLVDVLPPRPGLAPDALPTFGRALGAALDSVAARGRRIDLRQGDLRKQGDTAALKARIRTVAVALAAVFVAWLFLAWAQGRALDREAERLDAALQKITSEVMGKKLTDFDTVRAQLAKADKPVEGPLPRADVLDILAQLAKEVPSDIRHNITMLDIGPGKIAINGLTRNAEEAARIPQVLQGFTACVTDVGTLSGSGSEGNYTYQIEATTRCP